MLEHDKLLSQGEKQVCQLQEKLASERRKPREADEAVASIPERDEKNEEEHQTTGV